MPAGRNVRTGKSFGGMNASRGNTISATNFPRRVGFGKLVPTLRMPRPKQRRNFAPDPTPARAKTGGTSTGGGTTCDCAVPAAAGFSGDSCEVLSAAAQNCDANAAYSFVYDEAEGGAYCDFNGAARIADFQDATNADDRCYFYRAGDLPANRAGFLCDDHFGAGNFPSSALPAEVSFNCPANSELDGTTYSCVCSSSHPRGSPPDCHALRTLTVDASAADGVLAARTSGGTDIAEGNSAQIRTDESVVFTATPDSRLHVLLRWTGACGADGVNPEIVDRGRGAQTCEVPAGRADVQAGAVFGDLPCPPNSRVINSADPTRCVCNNGYYDKVGVDGDYETLECVTRRITRDHIAVQTGGNRCVKGAFDNAQQVDPFIAEFGIPCHFGNFIVNSRDCYIVRDGQVPVAGKAIRSDSRFVEYIGGPSAVSELGNYPDRLCEVMYPACDAGLGQLPADGNNPFAGCRVTSERCLAADAHSVPHGSGGYCVCDAANNYEGEVGSCELRRTVSVSAAQNGAVVLTVRLTSAAAGETARVASAAPATFIATPDSGYYVSRWTGACAADANPSPVSAPTGEGDAPAAPQTCVVAAGTEDISAGAEFAPIEDCASRHLTQATATTCGGVDYASLAAAQRIGAAEVARSCADAGGNAGTVRATGPDFAVVNDVGRRCTFASNDPRNCHALDPGKTVPEGYAILAPESNGYCDDIHPDCSVSGGESQLANNPLSGCKYVVNLDEVDNGTLTARWTGDARFPADLDDGDFVPGGATVTFAAAPNPGYYVSLWAGCGAADENTGEHSDGARKECEAVASAPLTVSVAFADIDECRTARNNCDANAACADHPFANVAPRCECNDRFLGDGRTCNPARTVNLSPVVNGMLAAGWLHAVNVEDGELVPQSARLVFTATPTVGYYVSGWTGDCENNATATTGGDDAPGTPQTCEVAPGSADVAAGATFAAIADCSPLNRVNETATTCGACELGRATADSGDADDGTVACSVETCADTTFVNGGTVCVPYDIIVDARNCDDAGWRVDKTHIVRCHVPLRFYPGGGANQGLVPTLLRRPQLRLPLSFRGRRQRRGGHS